MSNLITVELSKFFNCPPPHLSADHFACGEETGNQFCLHRIVGSLSPLVKGTLPRKSKMAEKTSSSDSGAGKLTQLPVARIKTIMKSSPDLPHFSQESVFLVTKATVSFL